MTLPGSPDSYPPVPYRGRFHKPDLPDNQLIGVDLPLADGKRPADRNCTRQLRKVAVVASLQSDRLCCRIKIKGRVSDVSEIEFGRREAAGVSGRQGGIVTQAYDPHGVRV